MSNIVKLLGGDPNKLCPLERLKAELKRFGYLAPMMIPMLIQISLSDSSEMPNSDGTGLSDVRQLEFDRRINELFEDIVSLGYYRKI